MAPAPCEHTIELVELLADGSARRCSVCSGAIFDAQGRSSLALALKVRVQLPSVSSMEEVELNVEVEHMSLRVHAYEDDCEQHSITLPAQCDPDRVGAKWSKKTKTLAVTLPLLAQQRLDAARLHALVAQSPEAATLAELQTILEQVDAANGEGGVDAHKGADASKDATTVAELQAKLRAAEAAAAALPSQPRAQATTAAILEQWMRASEGSLPEGTDGAELAPLASVKARVEAAASGAAAADVLPAMISGLDGMCAVRSMVAKAEEASKECSEREERERMIREEVEVTKALKVKVEAAAAVAAAAAAERKVAASTDAASRTADWAQGVVTTATDLAAMMVNLEKKAKEDIEAAKAQVLDLKAQAEVLKQRGQRQVEADGQGQSKA
jgi:hypothetical protein